MKLDMSMKGIACVLLASDEWFEPKLWNCP